MLVLLYALLLPFLVFCKILFSDGAGVYEGEKCILQNERTEGTCISIRNCSWALTRIKQREKVDKCSFVGRNPIVCCPLDDKFNSDQFVGASLGSSASSTPNKSPIQKESTSTSTSSASAWGQQRCEEYYPPPREGYFTSVGFGGELSLAQEFPHMAILGYGNENEKDWKCGGSLITNQHILTAAHCLESRDLGPVRYVRLGDLDIQNDTDAAEPQDFNVKMAISHPDFDLLTLKNDIAILVMQTVARITDYVKPGCLFLGGLIEEYADITATGWGITEFGGQPSSHLVKVALKVVTNNDCRSQYRNAGSRGEIDDQLQVCAGSAHEEKIIDTCDGDSGGPLQFTNYTYGKHFMIFGVTSFGKACGITRSPGVYTRVSSYLPWIESVVENNS